MKKIILIFVALIASIASAQTTYDLNWAIGSSGGAADLTIEVGDTVRWTWGDAPTHTVTSLAGSQETFGSTPIAGAGYEFSYTFTMIGTNPYQCNIHPGSMNGVITVQQQPVVGINYKAVIKDGSGTIVANTSIQVDFIILDGTASVYEETHSPSTDANGIIVISIGEGTPTSGTFAAIDWSSNDHFLNVKIDTGDGLQDMGDTPFKTVPYAMHSTTATTALNGQSSGTTVGEMQYWNGTAWVTVAPGSTGQVLTFVNGVPTWTTTAENTDVQNPTTGKIWMDRNLGASQVATSSTDADSYGDLYQWGRGVDGHQIRTSGTTATLSSSDTPGNANFILAPNSPYDWRSPQNTNLWQGVTGINNPCPSGYRLPTEIEWEAERANWSSIDDTGAYNSPLKLPVAGRRSNSDGSLDSVGSIGRYWSSTVDVSSSRYLYFLDGIAIMLTNSRAYGFSVRCIKE